MSKWLFCKKQLAVSSLHDRALTALWEEEAGALQQQRRRLQRVLRLWGVRLADHATVHDGRYLVQPTDTDWPRRFWIGLSGGAMLLYRQDETAALMYWGCFDDLAGLGHLLQRNKPSVLPPAPDGRASC